MTACHIHVGLRKTGSTTFQKTLHLNADALVPYMTVINRICFGPSVRPCCAPTSKRRWKRPCRRSPKTAPSSSPTKASAAPTPANRSCWTAACRRYPRHPHNNRTRKPELVAPYAASHARHQQRRYRRKNPQHTAQGIHPPTWPFPRSLTAQLFSRAAQIAVLISAHDRYFPLKQPHRPARMDRL